MNPIRVVEEKGWRVRMDLSGQVLRLDVPDWEESDGGDVRGDRLEPTLSLNPGQIVSTGALLLKAKLFDDGLYAAVELAAQAGAGAFAGKAVLLTTLAGLLATDPEGPNAGAASHIRSACELGGLAASGAENNASEFLGDENRFKPLGFYTWTPELTAIFRQDRFLQTGVDADTASALRRAIGLTPACAEIHDTYRRLIARLTNPPAGPSVRPVPTVPDGPDRPGEPGRSALFPASRSHEQEIVEQLYGDRPIPQAFDLLRELTRRVRVGELSLQPTSHSGWYDYQAWSLEPLIAPRRMPESSHLALTDSYRDHREEMFRAALALARETHVKQLASGAGGYGGHARPRIWICPQLTVEPIPTLYLRRAAGYRFLCSVLEGVFGADAIALMRRLTPNGRSPVSLADELRKIEQLFAGAYLTACRELGMEADPAVGDSEEAFARFADRAHDRGGDPDLGTDARMMVPVFFDVERRKTKVWAFLGWRQIGLTVSYEKLPSVFACEPTRAPEPDATDRRSVLERKFRKKENRSARPEPPDVQFTGESHRLATPVMAEVYVSRLLDRDEFRRHCDRYQTREQILANLL
jgi:hypothetical protein